MISVFEHWPWLDEDIQKYPRRDGTQKKTGVPIPSGIIVGRWLFLCHCCQGELAWLSVKIFHQNSLEDVAFFGDG